MATATYPTAGSSCEDAEVVPHDHRPVIITSSLAATGILLALVTMALFAVWLRNRPFRAAFRIQARRDDACTCRGSQQSLSVSLGRDGFELPPVTDGSAQTAFLVLHVQSTWLGRFCDPFIEVRHGHGCYRQYFERGVAGQRHLNLSPVFPGGGGVTQARVSLRGRWLRWRREATLSLFAPPPIDGARVLVLASHPDDAEIGAFGMYAGGQSWVTTLTAGAGGVANLSSVVPGADTARWSANLRGWDSLTVPQLAGTPRERCVNLVQPDGQLQNMYDEPARPFHIACEQSLSRSVLRTRNGSVEFQGGDPGCTWTGLIDDLRRLIEKADPDIVVSPHPLIDGHHDHVYTTVALEEAVRQLPAKPRRFFLYVVHRRGVPLYPFGSADALVSLPPWTDGEWLADSIYSHPLPPDTQRGKYFAIEAMHDLRTYQPGAPRSLRQVMTTVWRELSALVGGIGLPVGSFLRRAARPNEIYWVVSEGSLSELVRRAVAGSSTARARGEASK